MQEMDMSSTPSSTNNKNMLMIGGLLALVAVIGVGVVLARNSTNSAPSERMTASPTTTTTSPTGQVTTPATSPAATAETEATDTPSQVKTVNLEAGSFYFEPDVIRVKKGETVKIVMTSKDMMHDFNIDELDVKLPITRSGETNTVEFTATEAGTFEYYCSVGNHRAQGQVGTLIVEE